MRLKLVKNIYVSVSAEEDMCSKLISKLTQDSTALIRDWKGRKEFEDLAAL